nr:hypothetical protein [Tanacetum cinerariifolium]
ILHPQVVSIIKKHSSDRCEHPVTELVEFIQVHQPVPFELVKIDDSLRVVVCSVWGQVGDIKSVCLWFCDVELLLVAFDSQLKTDDELTEKELKQIEADD